MTAEAWITGEAPNQKINFRLPTGPKGNPGPPGDKGEPGNQGLPGTNAVPADEAVGTYATTPGTATHTAINATTAPRNKGLIHAQELGATGANQVNNAEFIDAATKAFAATRPSADGFTGTYKGTRVIDIPAGDYRITELQAMLGKEGIAGSRRGIKFRGAGSHLTHITFAPTTDGALVYNNYWQNVTFEGISFSTERPGATFMQSYTNNAGQRYNFIDVEWWGPWGKVFDLQGIDNNSEYTFHMCGTNGIQDTGAFLYVGATNTSEQFLNYYFYGFKHWSTSAPLIDAAKGGHYHIYGLDCSNWGVNLTAPGYLFNLRGGANLASGARSLTVDGLRAELKNNFAGMLYSEWAHGDVRIQADMWSQINVYTAYTNMIHLNFGVAPQWAGAVYHFHNSQLAGGVKITYGDDAGSRLHRVTFENCDWRQKERPSDVIEYVNTGTRISKPSVRFVNCRAERQNVGDVNNGGAVWDALVGWNDGDRLQQVQKRSLHIKSYNGNLTSGGTLLALLPVGAMITGMRVLVPAGTNTDTLSGTWTISTKEATPTVIASVTGPNGRNLGYNAVTELAKPFLCDTKLRASIALTASAAAEASPYTVVMVEGYW